jgi:hypothetical protein
MIPMPVDDLARARDLALRYRCEFVNLDNFQLQSEVLKKIPADVMFRYNFVPLAEMPDGRIAIAVADPSQLLLLDEITLLLGKRIVARVATLAQINTILNRVDESHTPIPDPPPDEPLGPSDPDAPVRAPLKPRPHLRSGAAKAVPEQEQ